MSHFDDDAVLRAREQKRQILHLIGKGLSHREAKIRVLSAHVREWFYDARHVTISLFGVILAVAVIL